MELQQIKYFLAVVDAGTFLAASQKVYVTQPTLSAGIKKLEAELGVALFDRGSRSATLTLAGQQFLAPVRQAYNQLISIKSELKEEPNKITIGVEQNIDMGQVVNLVSYYRLSHPHVLLEFVTGSYEELNKLTKQRKIDISIRKFSDIDNTVTPLIQERLCVAVHDNHPLSKNSQVELNSLSNQPFIERVNCDFWQPVNEKFRKENIKPHTIMQAESDEFVLSMVATDLGVSIITNRQTPYKVKFIPINDLSFIRYIGISKPNEDASAHIKDFYTETVSHSIR